MSVSLRGLLVPAPYCVPAPIQGKIERKHIDARLAENSESAALDVIRDEPADVIFRQVARLRNARHLEIGGFGRDVGVETASRRGYQIGWDPA